MINRGRLLFHEVRSLSYPHVPEIHGVALLVMWRRMCARSQAPGTRTEPLRHRVPELAIPRPSAQTGSSPALKLCSLLSSPSPSYASPHPARLALNLHEVSSNDCAYVSTRSVLASVSHQELTLTSSMSTQPERSSASSCGPNPFGRKGFQHCRFSDEEPYQALH